MIFKNDDFWPNILGGDSIRSNADKSTLNTKGKEILTTLSRNRLLLTFEDERNKHLFFQERKLSHLLKLS